LQGTISILLYYCPRLLSHRFLLLPSFAITFPDFSDTFAVARRFHF
jgi:hypothetical protein